MSSRPEYLLRLALAVILAVAFGLRLGAINETVVIDPIRADAYDYFNYAINLKRHGVYSRTPAGAETPQPDALRSPGYPLMLAAFAEQPPTDLMVWKVQLLQVVLDCLTVLLAFGIFRRLMSGGWALTATLLVAVSPHLISSTTYLLTETLFTFLTTAALWLTVTSFSTRWLTPAVAAGAVLALAALTRPTLQYFIVPLVALLVVGKDRRANVGIAVAAAAGFVLAFSPWIVRNLAAIGSATDPTLATTALHHGMYPDFMYRDIPESRGVAYRYDPRTPEIAESRSTVLDEIRRRFGEEPGRHLRWYLLGKPITLLSWNVIAGIGDVFVYPIAASPYLTTPAYYLTRTFMMWLHWPLVVLALLAAVSAWVPAIGRRMRDDTRFAMRLLSLVLAYFIVLHVAAAPYPRYGVPLRPVIYGLAILELATLVSWVRAAVSRRRPARERPVDVV